MFQGAHQLLEKLKVTGQISTAGAKIGDIEFISGASKTLVAGDSGKIFMCNYAGTMTVTLPANSAAHRGRFFILINLVNQTLNVAAATADTLITDGDTEADSVEFSTTSHKIGGCLLVIGNGSYWVAINLSGGVTMTVNT